jgi:hypothetical protein
MPRRRRPRSSTSEGQLEIVFTTSDPLGRSLSCDQETLDMKAGKHGTRFVSEDVARNLFEHPVRIAKSQHEETWAEDVSLYFRPYAGSATSSVKWIRGAVDFSEGEGVVLSVHPRPKMDPHGEIEYELDDTENTDAS